MKKKKILHLQTGGTITGNVPEYGEIEKLSRIFMDYVDVGKYIVYSFQSPCEYSVIKVCNKDSREITDVDRQRLVDEITMAYSQDGIKDFLITHGTYTMPDTAKYLDKGISEEIKKNISVVITGAMYPWSVLGSDAPMNIGAAISSLLNVDTPLGITISMHGKNWDIYKVEKDTENLIFHD